ncbi:STAS domain-containing protein [Streptomyces sp. B1866]|uniref:STAS domain-containing protein n=1 Tax=Streptomyces sp. B1866 TaxID=3075431 RepID=UPI00289179DE|nr:STAS domain-containing protein [Streptomyces sp. B1866]MDT3399384.1 STAS domain-containing protein [Streptomyces sp. B1866]
MTTTRQNVPGGAVRRAAPGLRPRSRLRTRTAGTAALVEVHGEIDLSTAPELTAALDAATARARPDVVVDLRPVTFLDCSGLSALCRARHRALDRGGRLRLVLDDPYRLRILRLAGLGGVFETHPDLAGALRPAATAPPGLRRQALGLA